MKMIVHLPIVLLLLISCDSRQGIEKDLTSDDIHWVKMEVKYSIGPHSSYQTKSITIDDEDFLRQLKSLFLIRRTVIPPGAGRLVTNSQHLYLSNGNEILMCIFDYDQVNYTSLDLKQSCSSYIEFGYVEELKDYIQRIEKAPVHFFYFTSLLSKINF